MKRDSNVLKMFKVQEKLNDELDGKDWKNGISKTGKKIDWKRAIWLKAAEGIESYKGWKHWKNREEGVDRENLKIETANIWQCIMSDILTIRKHESVNEIVDAFENMGIVGDRINKGDENSFSNEEQIDAFENIAVIALNGGSEYALVDSFFELCEVLNMNTEALHTTYMSKNMPKPTGNRGISGEGE